MVVLYLHVKEQFFSGEIKNSPLDLIFERIGSNMESIDAKK
jgi:hypothetical protein